jgi:hypothetical protein
MEPNARDILRRGVRAAVYRACWRRLEGDESGAQALLSCELPAALSNSGDAGTVDDELVRSWLDEDTADFDRAVLISDLVARRSGGGVAASPGAAPALAAAPARAASAAPEPPARRPRSPAIADLLDGMFEQERRARAVG